MQTIDWEPSEEFPESDASYLDIWICLSGGRVIPGLYVRNLDKEETEENFVWFDAEGTLIDPEIVQYWMLRVDENPPPLPR